MACVGNFVLLAQGAKMLHRLIVAFFLFMTVPAHGANAQDVDEVADICSIFECCLTNSCSWNSADLLVREKKFFDSTEIDVDDQVIGEITTKTVYYRVFFDKAKGTFAYAVAKVNEKTAFPGAVESVRSELAGWCCGNGGNICRLFPDGSHEISKRSDSEKDETKFLIKERFPDFSGFWLYRRPTRYGALKRDNDLKAICRGSKYRSHSSSGKELRISFDTNVQTQPGNEFLRTFSFDKELLALTGTKAEFKRQNGTSVEVAGFKLKSKELNGVVVPVLGRTIKSQARNRKFQKGKVGQADIEYKFHWFSINEEIEKGRFDSENFSKKSNVLSLVDPVIAGATTLEDQSIPVLEKE